MPFKTIITSHEDADSQGRIETTLPELSVEQELAILNRLKPEQRRLRYTDARKPLTGKPYMFSLSNWDSAIEYIQSAERIEEKHKYRFSLPTPDMLIFGPEGVPVRNLIPSHLQLAQCANIDNCLTAGTIKIKDGQITIGHKSGDFHPPFSSLYHFFVNFWKLGGEKILGTTDQFILREQIESTGKFAKYPIRLSTFKSWVTKELDLSAAVKEEKSSSEPLFTPSTPPGQMSGAPLPPGTPAGQMSGTTLPPGTPAGQISRVLFQPGTPAGQMSGTPLPPGTPAGQMSGTTLPPGTPAGQMSGAPLPPGTPAGQISRVLFQPGTPAGQMSGASLPPSTPAGQMSGASLPTGTPAGQMLGAPLPPGTPAEQISRVLFQPGTPVGQILTDPLSETPIVENEPSTLKALVDLIIAAPTSPPKGCFDPSYTPRPVCKAPSDTPSTLKAHSDTQSDLSFMSRPWSASFNSTLGDLEIATLTASSGTDASQSDSPTPPQTPARKQPQSRFSRYEISAGMLSPGLKPGPRSALVRSSLFTQSAGRHPRDERENINPNNLTRQGVKRAGETLTPESVKKARSALIKPSNFR